MSFFFYGDGFLDIAFELLSNKFRPTFLSDWIGNQYYQLWTEAWNNVSSCIFFIILVIFDYLEINPPLFIDSTGSPYYTHNSFVVSFCDIKHGQECGCHTQQFHCNCKYAEVRGSIVLSYSLTASISLLCTDFFFVCSLWRSQKHSSIKLSAVRGKMFLFLSI